MTHSTIDFLLNNNITIIQTVFAIIFLLVVFVIVKSFKEDKGESAEVSSNNFVKSKRKEESLASAPDDEDQSMGPIAETSNPDAPMDDLDNLDELMAMDEASTLIDGAAQSAANAAASAELTQALSEKEKVITDLKNEIASLQEKTKTSGDSSALESKVKELSDKLSEYEIIEDDIANLSFYKNENIKLKNELDKLKGMSGGAQAAPAATPTPPPPPVASTPADESVLNEFEQAVKQKEAIELNELPINAPVQTKSESDILKEFESVVDKELGGATTPAPLAPADDINSKKLVEEMEALAVAPPPPADEDDGKDNNQKLIEEFENFVNKG